MPFRDMSIVRSETETGHRAAAPLGEILVGAPDLAASVLLVLDLGAIRDDLRGVKIPFLELPCCASRVDLAPEGARYRAVDTDTGGVAQLWSDMAEELEEPLAENFVDDTEIPLGAHVSLVLGQGPVTWRHGDEVDWWQSCAEADFEVDSPEWLYAGTVTSDFFFGGVHAFYNTATREVRNVYECT